MTAKSKRKPRTDNPFFRKGNKDNFGYGEKLYDRKTMYLAKTYVNYVKNKNNQYVQTESLGDMDESIKLYINEDVMEKLCTAPKKGNTKDSDIKESTLRLFLYITTQLRINEDWVELGQLKIEEEINIRKTAYNMAVSQLEKLSIIKKNGIRSDIFFINPRYLFKGNRAQFIKDNYPEYLLRDPSNKKK